MALIRRRASRSPRVGLAAYFLALEIGVQDDPRPTLAMLSRRQKAAGDEATDGGRADRERRHRFVERGLAALGALAFTIDGDVVLTAK